MTGETGLMNVANVLTMVRIILIPVFVGCLLAGGTAWRLAPLSPRGIVRALVMAAAVVVTW